MSENQEEFLTVAELAERWKISKNNVYRLTRVRAADSIPRRKIGKNIRFVPSEVDAWAKKRAYAWR